MSAPAYTAALLVDGYNVIGAWPTLKKTRDRHGLEAARYQLSQTLANYAAYQGYQTQLVFDAQYRKGSCSVETITEHLSLYYTDGGQTADTYIELFCAAARQNAAQRLIVATSDRAQQLTVLGYGAEWMSAQKLQQDIQLVQSFVKQRQRSNKHTGRYLAHALDPVAKQRLEQLRMG